MSIASKRSILTTFSSIFIALFIAKALWVFVELKFLPKKGVDVKLVSDVKALYYHYNLASKKDKPKPIITDRKPKKVIIEPKPKAKPKPEEITKFTLKGIYNSNSKKIVLIEYLGKSYALSLGEKLKGYKFTNLTAKEATFNKGDKKYKLELFSKDKTKSKKTTNKQQEPMPIVNMPSSKKEKLSETKKEAPIQEGGTTYIPKSTFNKYKGNYAQIRRNINAIPNMENGKLNGFKISFVKSNSDFAKLGLKRGDIITAINGEPLNNFKIPLEFFNNIDSISAATLTIKRGNEIKELEYEVR